MSLGNLGVPVVALVTVPRGRPITASGVVFAHPLDVIAMSEDPPTVRLTKSLDWLLARTVAKFDAAARELGNPPLKRLVGSAEPHPYQVREFVTAATSRIIMAAGQAPRPGRHGFWRGLDDPPHEFDTCAEAEPDELT